MSGDILGLNLYNKLRGGDDMINASTTGKKIAELRKEKGLTLEQVANVVGVEKSTVRKWETGMITSMKQDKIVNLAKALGTTTAYLMNIESKEEADAKLAPPLSENEKILLDLFKNASETDKQTILRVIQAILDK